MKLDEETARKILDKYANFPRSYRSRADIVRMGTSSDIIMVRGEEYSVFNRHCEFNYGRQVRERARRVYDAAQKAVGGVRSEAEKLFGAEGGLEKDVEVAGDGSQVKGEVERGYEKPGGFLVSPREHARGAGFEGQDENVRESTLDPRVDPEFEPYIRKE